MSLGGVEKTRGRGILEKVEEREAGLRGTINGMQIVELERENQENDDKW